ncbi:MAG: cytochrome c biogenesis protein ResB [Bdellovibrionales bacterium]|nr:cytochrome c biogenesis protein ResB [Bdellovibrionales bacterium]
MKFSETAGKFFERIYEILISLKLAVITIGILLVSLITATFLESIYDTPTAQYWVYRSFWFYLVLLCLGLNILFVAISRWPWKKHHTAFLLAHLGIMMILIGSWITQRYGLDGNLRFTEGEASSLVELSDLMVVVADGPEVKTFPIQWTPPSAHFSKVRMDDYGLVVDRWITHAEGDYDFMDSGDQTSQPAVKIRVQGGPMRIVQDYWLWGGDVNFARRQAGPAQIKLITEKFPLEKEDLKVDPKRLSDPKAVQAAHSASPLFGTGKGPELRIRLKGGKIEAEAVSREGKKVQITAEPNAEKVYETGWKGNVTVSFLAIVPHATAVATYRPSQIQYGNSAPSSAIRIAAQDLDPQTTDQQAVRSGKAVWLGLGERAVFKIRDREVAMGFTTQRVQLPFSLKLKEFRIDRYDGSRDPKEYSSFVHVSQGQGKYTDPIHIRMNEPLQHNGITFYQASYEEGFPRPVTSILSVNRDPGRWLKYWGSLILVLGTILLFVKKYVRRSKA